MALWFECKVRYEKMQENGAVKRVNEPYLVDALSFTEAESRIIDAITPYISGEFTISAVKKTKIVEIFFNEAGDKYYNVKYNLISFDEKTGAEKKTSVLCLVQASDIESALSIFTEGMKGTISDYEVSAVVETPLMDVFPLELSVKKKEEA